jgi:hypothetical protein
MQRHDYLLGGVENAPDTLIFALEDGKYFI